VIGVTAPPVRAAPAPIYIYPDMKITFENGKLADVRRKDLKGSGQRYSAHPLFMPVIGQPESVHIRDMRRLHPMPIQ
jgi:hypothetical protein